MTRVVFHKDFIIREKGDDVTLKKGVHDIKEESSVKRWLKRGCSLESEIKPEEVIEEVIEEVVKEVVEENKPEEVIEESSKKSKKKNK